MIKMMRASAVVILSGLLLASCNNTLYKTSQASSADVKNQIDSTEQQQYPRPPAVVEQKAPYVDVTPVSLEKPPKWFKRSVSIHGSQLPFSFYVDQVVGDTGTLVDYDGDIKSNKLLSFSYKGTAKGALDALANKTDFFYHYDQANNQLDWSSLETRVFDISFMPGASQYQLGQSAGSGLSSSGGGSSDSSSSGGSSGSSSGGASGYDFTQDSQYSNLTGNISVWDDLSTTIKGLLSKDGKVTISQSTTTVTVHDHPSNVKAIDNYIQQMNEEMSRQVRIYVQVLAVTLGKDYSEGINWDLVRKDGGNTFSLYSSNATNSSTFSSSLQPLQITWSASGGLWDGTQTFIQALQEQGTVSEITEPVVTTLNNQVATISLQQQQAYVSGYSGGSVSGDVAALPSPTVSNLVTGFNLYLLPKIQGNRVYLEISSVLSDLVSLSPYNANTGTSGGDSAENPNLGDGDGSGSGDNGDNGNNGGTVISTPQTVQEPTVDFRSFNQRTVIPNGATLIMAGFKQNADRSGQSKFLNTAALGGQGASTSTQEVLVLITPVIISNAGNNLSGR